MKKILSFAAILLLVAGSLSCMISCKKENPAQVCDVDNPLTDISWLKQFIDNIKKMSLLVINDMQGYSNAPMTLIKLAF
ncbi:MAG: hypothetical protein LBG80_16180 [Bacteroidales bacterium]|jgi:hypothetical protein|nr:hypothetical protein [Bacteroidales bacterium]